MYPNNIWPYYGRIIQGLLIIMRLGERVSTQRVFAILSEIVNLLIRVTSGQTPISGNSSNTSKNLKLDIISSNPPKFTCGAKRSGANISRKILWACIPVCVPTVYVLFLSSFHQLLYKLYKYLRISSIFYVNFTFAILITFCT